MQRCIHPLHSNANILKTRCLGVQTSNLLGVIVLALGFKYPTQTSTSRSIRENRRGTVLFDDEADVLLLLPCKPFRRTIYQTSRQTIQCILVKLGVSDLRKL